MKHYLAIDLGASSGRHVIGHEENGEIVLEEIHRFKTEMDDSPDGLVWDIPRLLSEIKLGIKKAFARYPHIESLSIDTWGVDYVLMDGDKEIPPYYAYRNARCLKAAAAVHAKVPFEELYRHTGIQFAPFNTLYQLYDDKEKGRLEKATDYLMLPSYFSYKLTGKKSHEYTDESTGALLNAETGGYDEAILKALGLPKKLFGKIEKPGTVLGGLLPEVEKEVGGNCPVLLAPSHDTAASFESVDLPEDTLLLSSGTWSLLGIKAKEPIINEASLQANYTNEGGVGYIRFLKNIMGMYLSNRLRQETGLGYEEIAKGVEESTYQQTFDVDDPSLSAPKKMKEAVLALLKKNPPKTAFDLFASVYRSMALGYRKAIEELEGITKKNYRAILVLGGGAKNQYLNRMIEACTGKQVIPMPIEATALGNIKNQMKKGQ